jgi:hypothetical protein
MFVPRPRKYSIAHLEGMLSLEFQNSIVKKYSTVVVLRWARDFLMFHQQMMKISTYLQEHL